MPHKKHIDPTNTFYFSRTAHKSFRIWVAKQSDRIEIVSEILDKLSVWNGSDADNKLFKSWEFSDTAVQEYVDNKGLIYQTYNFQVALYMVKLFGLTSLTDEEVQKLI